MTNDEITTFLAVVKDYTEVRLHGSRDERRCKRRAFIRHKRSQGYYCNETKWDGAYCIVRVAGKISDVSRHLAS